MQNRIDRLENLVLSLMTTGQGASTASAQAAINGARQSTSAGADGSHNAGESIDQDDGSMMQEDQPEDDSDINDVSQGLGIMKVDGGKAVFASDAHWHAILANVSLSNLFDYPSLAELTVVPTDCRSSELLRKPQGRLRRSKASC